MSWKKYLDYDFENDIDDSEREAREQAVDDDLAKVRSIVESCDMKSSKEVTRIYLLVKDYKIGFKTSKVRNNFLSYLAETAAVNRAREAEKNQKVNKRLNIRKVIFTFVGFALIAVSVIMLTVNMYNRNKQLEQQDTMNNLQQMHRESGTTQQSGTDAESGQKQDDGSASDADNEDGDNNAQTDADSNVSGTNKINSELASMYEINTDLAGWISIDGTGLDYPVLKGTDNDYYLTRDFYGQNSRLGSIFMDYRNDFNDINIIIYGHNSSNGQMFGYLNSYKNESFYKAHKEIRFDTLYEHHTYEIIAVCQGRVRYIDEEGFRYYNYTNDEYELDSFFMDMRKQSIYQVDHEFENSDRFITLSTCSNDSDSGRLYVVAVRRD